MKMNNLVNLLARTDGDVTLEIGGRDIPVKITEITVDHNPIHRGGKTTLKCETQYDAYRRSDYSDYLNLITARKMETAKKKESFEIERVIFSKPATIVFWKDGSKTVVKCQDGDAFSEEMGLAMAICKKVFGNKGNYYNEFKKWLPEEEPEEEIKMAIFANSSAFARAMESLNVSIHNLNKTFDPKRLGCVPVKNEKGELIGRVLSVDTDKGTFVGDIDDDATLHSLVEKECSVKVVKA